jgi:hypothetical protein
VQPRQYEYRLTVAAWLPILLSTVLPALWYAFYHRRQRIKAQRIKNGLCVTCGYDLRASGNRCPECGVTVDSAMSAKTT